MNSPWLDINRCMPSIWKNTKYDYLPAPAESGLISPEHCDIWPSKPPRADVYCEGSALCHPLVSPLAALDWKGAPPIYIMCGEEMLADEDSILAHRLYNQGVKVIWEQYEAMPHVFGMMFEGTRVAEMSFDGWAAAIKMFVEEPGKVKSSGTWITAKKLERVKVDVGGEVVMSDEECLEVMRASRDKRIKGFGDAGMGVAPVPAEARL